MQIGMFRFSQLYRYFVRTPCSYPCSKHTVDLVLTRRKPKAFSYRSKHEIVLTEADQVLDLVSFARLQLTLKVLFFDTKD